MRDWIQVDDGWVPLSRIVRVQMVAPRPHTDGRRIRLVLDGPSIDADLSFAFVPGEFDHKRAALEAWQRLLEQR